MDIKLTKELDQRLRDFIADPTDFMVALGLTNAFHKETVLAVDKPYVIELTGQQLIPVFTDQADLEAFKSRQASAVTANWVNRSVQDVLREAIEHGLTGLVFNLKKGGDQGNSTVFHTSDLITFVNHHTQVLNLVLGEDNQKADKLAKHYLIPAFILENDEGDVKRIFSSMSNPDKASYLPVFTNMTSFAKWYYREDFGGRFRASQGLVLIWKLETLLAPSKGQNELEGISGVAVNPFVDQMELLTWEDIKEK